MDIIKNSSLVNALHDYYLEERKKYNNFANFNIEFTSNNIEGYLLYKLPLDENLNTTKVAILDEMENGNLKAHRETNRLRKIKKLQLMKYFVC